MDRDYNVRLDTGSYVGNRDKTIESMNLSTPLIKQNREGIYSKLFYVFSLNFAVLIAMFSESINWLAIFLFLNLSMVFLVWHAKNYYLRRQDLAKDHYEIIDNLKEFGIHLPKL